MLRLIRVILSAQVHGFVSGMRQAEHSLGSFVKAAGLVAGGIAAAFAGLPMIINGLISSVEQLGERIFNLGKALIEPAMNAERFKTIVGNIVGSGDQAAEMFAHLEDISMQYGFAMSDLTVAGQQMSVMLKGMNGEVNPEEWEQWLNVLLRLHAIRPDVSMQNLARGLSSLAAGDVSTLSRLLDVDVQALIETLGPEFQGFLQDAEGATETQLGRVTRIGEQAGGAMGDALSLANELANAIGADEALLEAYGQTFEAQVGRLMGNWEHLKLVFGEPILEVLNDGLERFLDFLEEHQEDIDAFVRQMGELAAVNLERFINWLFDQDWEAIAEDLKEIGENIYEFFASPETQAAFQSIVDSLKAIGETTLDNFISFLEDTDWTAIRTVLEAIAGALNSVAEAYQMLSDLPGLEIGANLPGVGEVSVGIRNPLAEQPPAPAPGAHGGVEPEIAALQGGQVPVETLTGAPGQQEIIIRIGVDENGNLTPYIDSRVDAGIAEVVGEVRTSRSHFNREAGH